MNVLIDGIVFALQKVGGVSTYWLQLLPAMADAAPDLSFFVTAPSRMQARFHNSNITTLPLGFVVPRRIFRFFDPLRLRRACSKSSAHILHSTYFTSPRNGQVRKVITIYDMILELFPQHFAFGARNRGKKEKLKATKAADMIIAISESTKQDIVSHYEIPPERIRAIHLGVSPAFREIHDKHAHHEFRQRFELQEDLLLYIGKRREYKNFSTVLKALSELTSRRRPTLLCIGGESGLNATHVREAQKLDVLPQVHHIPFLDESGLILAYNCAKALVYPSMYEGFGLPIVEAMACGTPVVASNIPVLRESGGDAALYANPRDPSAFAGAIERVLSDDAFRKELVRKGLENVKRFSWERAARQTLQVYRSLLE